MTNVPLREPILDWSTTRFWALVCGKGTTITAHTRWFVEAWLQHVRTGTLGAVDGEAARKLVRSREILLKRAQSRFQSHRAREQWSGYAGLGVASYRWSNVRTLLDDLREGFASTEQG